MKKISVLLLLCVALVATPSFAQDGNLVEIKYIPEKIEILPGVWEFFGTSVLGVNTKKDFYALTLSSELQKKVTDTVKLGYPQYLWGPRLEPLSKEMILSQYKGIRQEIEDTLKLQMLTAKKVWKFHKAKIYKQKLITEQGNTPTYVKQLSEKIDERSNQRSIYVYGRTSTFTTASMGENNTTPVTRSRGGTPPEVR